MMSIINTITEGLLKALRGYIETHITYPYSLIKCAIERKNANPEEKAKRVFFIRDRALKMGNHGRAMAGLGLFCASPFSSLLLFTSLTEPSCSGGCLFILSVPLALIGVPLMFFGLAILSGSKKVEGQLGPEPEVSNIREWLFDGIAQIRNQSLIRLGFSESSLSKEFSPHPIISPILWSVEGVEHGDILWRKSESEMFFGIYNVVFTHFTDDLIGVYSCHYNFIRGTTLSDEAHELYHKDIALLSTKESSSSKVLPTGERLVHSQKIFVSATNGKTVPLGSSILRLESFEESTDTPMSNTEQVASAIRTLIFNRKSEVSEDLEGFGDPGPWS